jgi:hypothetical protein
VILAREGISATGAVLNHVHTVLLNRLASSSHLAGNRSVTFLFQRLICFALLLKDSACLFRTRLRNIPGNETQSVSCDSTQGNPERWRVEKDQHYENIYCSTVDFLGRGHFCDWNFSAG